MTSTSNSFIATTLAPTRETLSSPTQLLTPSFSSFSRSSRQNTSQISKIYRQSSTLFLTRRLPESLSTIFPVITPPPADDTGANSGAAPIFKAAKTTRVKVWSLYLTILNAVLELDPDEGKVAFGSAEWRALVQKVREGSVWEEVVRHGYGGMEGDVDADVVINLTTLLLAHARSQKTNQARLETYLATSAMPSLNISPSSLSSPRRPSHSSTKSPGGTDTPRDLNARVRILELYTLHVLLRNNEWEYAREFISISPVLDEERREAFLQALQSLHEEQHESERRQKEEQRHQEEQLKKDIENARRRRNENEERERRREKEQTLKRSSVAGSEVDYGVDEKPARPGSAKSRSSAPSVKGPNHINHNEKLKPAPSSRTSPAAKLPPSILARAGNIISNIRKLMEGVAGNFKTKPLFLLQFTAFLIGVLIITGRRDIKERLGRLLGGAWGKVRGTVKMGGKVSYI
ncbi:hypothetical protein PZA11_004658 [Diplocarpon coronariae]|uniref:Peroxin 26 n=1 Tax=Diplocarpon coronariae TaxID=2795749 RepID=A0A218YTK8_9HELO|nr:peroxin 26 [Diplocarpon mali]OWO97309.1 hypothetical protein B2J93_9581 [Marssonina coronariae]